MERNDAITTLEVLKTNCSILSRDYQALDYAISSLKTDEAYQLMYEGVEVYTKADMVAMLTEIQLEIEEKEREVEFMDEYSNGYNSCLFEISRLIQQKINSQKENTDG